MSWVRSVLGPKCLDTSPELYLVWQCKAYSQDSCTLQLGVMLFNASNAVRPLSRSVYVPEWRNQQLALGNPSTITESSTDPTGHPPNARQLLMKWPRPIALIKCTCLHLVTQRCTTCLIRLTGHNGLFILHVRMLNQV